MKTVVENLKHHVARAKKDLHRSDLNENSRAYCNVVIKRGKEALQILKDGGSENYAMSHFQGV